MRSWTQERFVAWSKGIGSETSEFVDMLIKKKEHPEQAFRAILGLQRLAKKYSSARLENACKRANYYKLTTMGNVRSILETHKDQEPLGLQTCSQSPPIIHANLRGATNFH